MFLPKIVFDVLLALASAATTSTHGCIPPTLSSSHQFFLMSRNIVSSVVIMGGIGVVVRWGIYHYNSDLKKALLDNDLEQVRYAIAWGADINEPITLYDNYSRRESIRPIYYVIKYNLFDILRFFLKKNVERGSKNFWDKTPLDYAIEDNKKDAAVCLFFNKADAYDMDSGFLSEGFKDIFTSFRMYCLKKEADQHALYYLMTSHELQKISYAEKNYDAISFALDNNDFQGIEYCKKQQVFSNQDVLMTLAESDRLTKFLLWYLQDINVKTVNFSIVYSQAKKFNNIPCANFVKKYAQYVYGIKRSKLDKKMGDGAIIQKILSYVDCNN